MSKIENAIRDAVVKGAKEAADSAGTHMVKTDVPMVASKIVTQVAPIVAHATNSEPWYQSRVTLGAILAAVAGVLGVFGYAFPEDIQGKVIDLIVALGPIIGAALALYGRWAAKKPIGN